MSSKKNQSADERFLRVQKDPRFWEMPEREHKVKIDKRFQSMFHDKRFKVKYTVDKRGRPINHTSTEDLKRFYKLSDSEEEEEEEDEEDKKSKKKKKTVKESLVKADGEVKRGTAEQSRAGKDKGERPERGVRVIEEGEEVFVFTDTDWEKITNQQKRLITDQVVIGGYNLDSEELNVCLNV